MKAFDVWSKKPESSGALGKFRVFEATVKPLSPSDWRPQHCLLDSTLVLEGEVPKIDTPENDAPVAEAEEAAAPIENEEATNDTPGRLGLLAQAGLFVEETSTKATGSPPRDCKRKASGEIRAETTLKLAKGKELDFGNNFVDY